MPTDAISWFLFFTFQVLPVVAVIDYVLVRRVVIGHWWGFLE